MLLGLLLVIGGGLVVDSMPVEKKPEIKTVFKKTIHINNPNWKMDMLVDSINRRMEHGDSELSRCLQAKCSEVSELTIIK